MQKQILPINAYIINDLDHTIRDIFTDDLVFGGISGADVYHGVEGDHYFNALLTEDMKARVTDALNQVYSSNTPDTKYFAFSNGVFQWSTGDTVWVSGEGEGSARLNYGGNYAVGAASVAYGNGNRASGIGSHAEGSLTNAKGNYSHAEGYNADASGLYSHAEGEYCKAWGQSSHAEGYYTLAFDHDSHAEGRNIATDYTSIGKFTGEAGAKTYTVTSASKSPDLYDLVQYKAKNTYARVLDVQIVSGSYTNRTYTVVLDKTLDASSAMNNTSVYRISHIAYNIGSHAEGMTTKSMGQGSHAEGSGTISAAYASHAEGDDTQAKGQYSHAEGQETMALGEKSHSEGFSTFAFGLAAHAEGLGVITSTTDKKYIVRITGDVSTTSYTTSASHNLKPGDLLSYNPVGYIPSNIRNIAKVLTTPTATSFTVDNTLNSLIAFSDTSVVNLRGIATAKASHSEGYFTKATGVGSHSEGYDTRTDSSYSHAEGESTDASGIGSHTEGYYTNTFANYSHAEGRYTRTSNMYEHTQGSYNMSHNYDTSFGNSGNTLDSIGIGVSDASRSNAIEVMQNGDIYVKGVGSYDGSNYIDASTLQEVINSGGSSADLTTSITYSALKALRDASALIPGMQYRITDYICTTTQSETQAASNLFDIIVTADSSTVLNENARAYHHTGDTYFESCNLEAWELKYCLDNDTSRFLWADSTNGKGVIYYMKDERNNECPYDFKNIQFRRYAITAFTKNLALVVNNPENGYGFYYGAKDDNGDNVLSEATYGNDFDYFYTFAGIGSNSGNHFDYSVNGISGKTGLLFAQNDSIGIAILTNGIRILNNNVLFGSTYTNYNIKTGANCLNWTCGNSCSEWKCGDNCSNWVCANECTEWVCTSNCNSWTCGVRSHRWTCGNNCSNWKCGDNCSNWTCGSYSSLWTCGNECSDWSCGVVCNAWTCGNNCSNWTCGNNCNGWTCGNECNGWTCGNECKYWNCNDKIQNFTMFNNIEYIDIINTSNTNPQQPTCNFQILDGTKGISANTRLSINFETNKNYTQIAGLNSSGVLKIWTPADLID